jgi:hypothetical protein
MSAIPSFSDADREKQNGHVHNESVDAPLSPGVETEKPRLSNESAAVVDGGAEEDEEAQHAGEYVTGAKLLIIVLALVLSVFLFSLDQVSYKKK